MSKTEPIVRELMNTIPQVGRVSGITIRPRRREMPLPVKEVLANDSGLVGDHFEAKHSDKRQVTLIQEEHLRAVASILDVPEVDHRLTRRNILVTGINLLSLIGHKFQIGDAVLEGTGPCHPCSRMEENLGAGGYNAMRGHGGITARVIKPGFIRVNSMVRLQVR